jgi:signal transduction histidine kinase
MAAGLIATEDFEGMNDAEILLTIADTGAGIPVEHCDRIFDAFFTTRSAIGTGIGLFVAKQFVEAHHGTIRVESSTDSASHGRKDDHLSAAFTSHSALRAEDPSGSPNST